MLKPRVIRMALAVDYINGYLKQKGVAFDEIADVCDKLISFEVREKPIDEFKLDELAREELNLDNITWSISLSELLEAFKAGYRKAKEE